MLFVIALAGLYLLVFLTGDRQPTPKLGIDLVGGTRVTLTTRTLDGSSPTHIALRQAQQIIGSRVNGLGVAGSEVVIDGDNLVITVPGDDGSAVRNLGQTARLYIRPVIGQPTPAEIASKPSPSSLPAAASQKDNLTARIEFEKELRQSTDPNIQQSAVQYMVSRCGQEDVLAGRDDPNLPLVACSVDHTTVYVLDKSMISGDQITDASASLNQDIWAYAINLAFNPEATDTWATFTTNNVGKLAAFTLDSQVVSAPQIRVPITNGRTQIDSGKPGFTADSAKQFADILKYGSLPLSFQTSEAETVSATLGLTSLRAGLIAGAIGLALVLVYSLLYYRWLGLLMVLSLVASGAMVFGILVLLGRYINYSLDLAGIAGLIIGIGTTADSFVVLFERIKDQTRRGGTTFWEAVPRGWIRARKTILSGNAVTFLAAVVLYILAVGQVKGFAFTLGLTTVLDVVVVSMVTAPLMLIASKSEPFRV
ncbi:protein translocase subunit SecD [Mycolicibacterium helvum]|uniref:Protein translocase subunit SecD n=1 Tax=Mycolicibacterium helvum TaxID=1534349 RepID=A0A7I7T104_9MYCO|nr:protein translocase subunit SecD [Mycolicibacterium helvum]